jgi:tRNA/tmRNA/rRNA uracil-C5-methylase (TrmA/RlmC/RlmD family)
VVELSVTGLAVGGDGIARAADGRIVFVEGGLPGEVVGARVHQQRKDFARAAVVEVLEASPHRVAPPCPALAAGCGGCDWQHLRTTAQPTLKAGIVAEALRRQARLGDVEVVTAPALPTEGYRTTVRAAVQRDGRLGLRGRRSHDIVSTDGCLVAHPLVADLLATTAVDRRSGAEEVVLRAGVATGDRAALVLPNGRFHRVPGDVAVGPDAAVVEVVHGHRFRVGIRSFFQAGPDAASALVDAVRSAVTGAPEGPMVDLYAGVGLFAALVEPHRPVTAVEWSASSTADARVNLQHRDARIVEADVTSWKPEPAAVVVADPARSGLGVGGVQVAAGTGAARICLISCDVGAFARDARLLVEAGYGLQTVTVVDCFPHTAHVEVVSSFGRQAGTGRGTA